MNETASGKSVDKPVILHVGRDTGLLSTRSQVLRLTGAPVVSDNGITELDVLLDRHTHGLLVLCHSLSESDRDEVLRKVREQRPRFKSLLVSRDESARRTPSGDPEVISALAGPQGLVKRAKQLLSTGDLCVDERHAEKENTLKLRL